MVMIERINWMSGTPRDAIESYLKWRDAVEEADAGDLRPLTTQLRTEERLGPEARILIADLLERHNLRRKRGRQPTPAYKLTPVDALQRDAVEKADAGDLRPLATQLRAEEPLDPEARTLIADLLQRHNLRRKRGRQTTPAYKLTAVEAKLNEAAKLVRHHKKYGEDEDEALRQALINQARAIQSGDTVDSDAGDEQRFDISEEAIEKLRNHVRGWRGSSRRQKRRRQP